MFNFLNTKIVNEQLKRIETVTLSHEATTNDFPLFINKDNVRKISTRDTNMDLLNNRDNQVYYNIDHEFNKKFENIMLKTGDDSYLENIMEKIKSYISNKDFISENIDDKKSGIQLKISKSGYMAFVKGRMLLLMQNDRSRLYNITDLKRVEWHPVADRLAVMTTNSVYLYNVTQWDLNLERKFNYKNVKQFIWDSSGEYVFIIQENHCCIW
jgi:hypothetical protein